eukprot:TRINITY_DN1032_c0_g3_i1.p1 TRINITY_DN1032_c0_g3~~TRINITY_DN1032_c0_g3_i1.p1  ORF type:complete len:805 (+),score=94.57 TRINITY_DN1032_c0_g3_i1:26-2416(+)
MPNVSESANDSDGNPSEVTFTVSVTTLSMGLKTFKISVSGATTVGELKSLIEQQDDSCPPPNRQRLIYNKQELSNPEVRLEDLNPPAGDGAKFSMAWELSIDTDHDEPALVCTVIHYHDVTEHVTVDPGMKLDDLLYELKSRPRGEIWNSGVMLYNSTQLEGGEVLSDLENFADNPVLQFFPQVMSNQLGMNGGGAASAVGSEPSGITLEVRFYQGTGFDGVTLTVDDGTTVGELKEIIAQTYESRGKHIPRTRQHLVYSGQVKRDDELVSSFPLLNVGGVPIFQLYERQTDSEHPLLPRDQTDQNSVTSSSRGNTPEDLTSEDLKSMQLCFIWLVIFGLFFVLMFLGARNMSRDGPISGFCSPTVATWKNINCTRMNGTGDNYVAHLQAVLFNTTQESLPDPEYDAFTVLNLPDYQNCGTYGAGVVAIVSGTVPHEICAAIDNASVRDSPFLLDGYLGDNGRWYSSRGPIEITENMFAYPSATRVKGDRLVVTSPWSWSQWCNLGTLSAGEADSMLWKNYVCGSYDTVDTLGLTCAAARPIAEKNFTFPGFGQFGTRDCHTVCVGYCKTQHPNLDTAAGGGCCASKETKLVGPHGTSWTCNCGLYNGTAMVSGSTHDHAATVVKPVERVPSKDTVFYHYKLKKMPGEGDLLKSSSLQLDGCARECVTTAACKTFTYTTRATSVCELFSTAPEDWGGLRLDAFTDTFTTTPKPPVIASLPVPSGAAYEDECEANMYDLLANTTFPCYMKDGVAHYGATDEGDSMNPSGVAKFVVSFFFMCCCCCIAWCSIWGEDSL